MERVEGKVALVVVRVAGSAGRVLSVSDVKAQRWSAPISMPPRPRRPPRKLALPADALRRLISMYATARSSTPRLRRRT
jgi:hypothetical protein